MINHSLKFFFLNPFRSGDGINKFVDGGKKEFNDVDDDGVV